MNKYYDREHLSGPDTETKLELLEGLENRLRKLGEELQTTDQKNSTIQELLRKISFNAMHIKDGTHAGEFDEFRTAVEALEKE